MGLKGKLYGAIISVGLLAVGGHGLATAMTNREPVTYAADTYLRERPDDEWLTLTNASIDLTQAGYSSIKVAGNITDVYVPLFASDDEEQSFVSVVLLTTDPDIRQTVKEMKELLNASDEEILEYLDANIDRIFFQQDVSGLVDNLMTSDAKEDLEAIYGASLSPNVVLIKHNGKPSLLISGLLMGGGVLMGGLMIRPMLTKG